MMRKPLIQIDYDVQGTFVARPNRFLALVDVPLNGKSIREEVHVHDPGRLPDILQPGRRVLLCHVDSPKRKTKWDMIAGKVGDSWVLVHSGYHRRIVERLLEEGAIDELAGIVRVIPERKLRKSRIDFFLEMKTGPSVWMEVKGCTLVQGNIAKFPDAPTKRGVRHVEELVQIKKGGARAALLFLIFRPESSCFLPNGSIDYQFEQIFWEAIREGVEIYCLKMRYSDGGVFLEGSVPVCSQK